MNRVIIVDDDENVCEVLRRKLHEAGYHCTVANKGARAFETLKEVRPDLILLDLMMPEVTGFRLCRMIRRDPLLYTIPVIVLALAEDEQETLHCMEQGADAYLLKPIVAHELMRKVRGLLLLREMATKPDPATGMPGLEAVKREINHKLARSESVAACYLEFANLRTAANRGASAATNRDELVRDAARLIEEVTENLQIYELFAAYVGAAHFVVLLNLYEYQKFCKRVIEKFDSELLPRWRRGALGQPYPGVRNFSERNANQVAPKVSIGVTHNQYRNYKSADKMFRVLAEVQRKAQESPTSSYFIDRRRVDR